MRPCIRAKSAACALLLVLAPLPACGGDEAKPAKRIQSEKAAPAPTPEPPSPYDEDGRLRESGERVAGVPVPVGLSVEPGVREREHVLRTDRIPLDKVVQFYGPRLFTGQIDREGAGVIYREAVPMDRRDQKTSVDVRIMPTGRREVKVTLREHAAAPLVAPSVSELEKTLRREQKQIE